jgi:hypothetical protein
VIFMVTTDKLKNLLGIAATDTSQDVSLSFILDDIAETILNYCNLTELPSGLEHTAYRMAIDLYRNDGVGEADGPAVISSITEGDTTVQFRKSVDENFKDTLLKNYIPQLNRYRRVSWP